MLVDIQKEECFGHGIEMFVNILRDLPVQRGRAEHCFLMPLVFGI